MVLLLVQSNISAQQKMEIQFGEPFTLLNNVSTTIGDKDHPITIELTDFMEEWGYDAPPEVENRNYYSDVLYTIKIKAKETEKDISFYSSEINQEGDFSVDLMDYKLIILSDNYQNSSASIEMIINHL